MSVPIQPLMLWNVIAFHIGLELDGELYIDEVCLCLADSALPILIIVSSSYFCIERLYINATRIA